MRYGILTIVCLLLSFSSSNVEGQSAARARLVVQTGHRGTVNSVAYSPNGKTIATGSDDNTIILWDAATAGELRSLKGHTARVEGVAFSPNGKTLASASWDSTVRVWDVATGICLHTLNGISSLTSIAFSPDGQLIAAGGQGKEVLIWNAVSGGKLRTLTGHTGYVNAVAFGRDGRTLLSRDEDGTVRSWNIATGRETRKAEITDWIYGITLSADQERVVANLDSYSDPVESVVFGADGKSVATKSEKTVKLWDGTARELKNISAVEAEKLFGPEDMAIVSHDGKTLVEISDSDIVLRDAITKEELIKLSGHSSRISSVVFTPDDKLLVSASYDYTIRVWDITSGLVRWMLKGHTARVNVAVLSSDGKTVASASDDNIIKLWSVATGKELRTLTGHSGGVGSIEFSPSGKLLLSGGEDGTSRLWNVATGSEICSLVALGETDWAVVAPDGRFDTNKIENSEGIHWVISDDPLTPKPLELFMRQYFEPGLLHRVLKCNEDNNCDREFKPLLSIADTNRVQPKVIIKEIKAASSFANFVDVTVEVENVSESVKSSPTDSTQTKRLSSGVYDLRLFRDGQLVGSSAPRELLEKYIKDAPTLVEKDRASKTLLNTEEDKAWREANDLAKVVKFDAGGKATFTFKNIKLPKDGKNEIEFSVYGFNVDRVKSNNALQTFKVVKPEKRLGKTYLVTIGVNASENPQLKLRYAANDARKMQEVLGSRLKATNPNLIQIPLISDYDANGNLTENTATKPIIKGVFSLLAGHPEEVSPDVLEKIGKIAKVEPIQPEDTLVITFAGHGYADQNGIFYLVPYDVGKDTEVLSTEFQQNLISSDELALWMRDITSKEMIFIVDACHSAAAVQGDNFKPGPMGSRGLGQLAYDKGMRILAATQADNAALELAKLKQGLLSFALIQEGINEKKADTIPEVNQLTAPEWLSYAVKRVPEIYEEVKAGKRTILIDDKVATPGQARLLTQGKQKGAINLQQPTLFDFNRRNKSNVLFKLQ